MTATKWIVLVYGAYGLPGDPRSYDVLPKVLEIDDAETIDDVWDKLRLGALTGGDPLDELKATSIRPSLESTYGERTGPDPVRPTDTSQDTKVRVFRADEVSFSFLDEYMTARVARETEERKAADEASQLAAMQAIAARLGYQCVKAGS